MTSQDLINSCLSCLDTKETRWSLEIQSLPENHHIFKFLFSIKIIQRQLSIQSVAHCKYELLTAGSAYLIVKKTHSCSPQLVLQRHGNVILPVYIPGIKDGQRTVYKITNNCYELSLFLSLRGYLNRFMKEMRSWRRRWWVRTAPEHTNLRNSTLFSNVSAHQLTNNQQV